MILRPITKPEPIIHDGFKLYECKQGSPEWLSLRAGVLTASEFKKARGKLKRASGDKKAGDWTEGAEDYAFQKAIERISGVPLDENVTTWQMKRGNQLEPFARMAHEDRLLTRDAWKNFMVMPAGFMTTIDGVFGCSVDGLIEDQGGSEYKCLVSSKGLRKVTEDDDITAFMDQVQGCMWISGRTWWHFGLYCPALKPIGLEFQMIEVERDDDYIEVMEEELIQFNALVDEKEAKLRAKGIKLSEEAVAEVMARLMEPATEQEPAALEEA